MSSIIHKKHKDRFRIQFCDQNFYIRGQNTFKLWKTQFADLNNVEKLQAWVIALSCLRRPSDWFGGRRSNVLFENKENFSHSLTLHELFKNTSVKISPKISSDINLFDFINNYRIKALPETCFRSLCHITDNSYPLIITDKMISADELLKIQISGKRVVALNEDYETWPHTSYFERDFLGFILHDLIHADHFFHEPQHRHGQLGFYFFIENIINEDSTQNLLKNESFKNGFDYIISDMNSHPVHLFQTLHSLLFSEIKNDNKSTELWQHWVGKSNYSQTKQDALLKVNSAAFTQTHAECI